MHFKHLYLRSFRLFLFPISILYGIVVALRNLLYDKKVITSVEFNIPIICVGNISVGGTGKSPMVMYLAEFLKKKYAIATLSRGFKRRTSGYILASEQFTANELGDEPMQFYLNHPDVAVAVGEKRIEAIPQLLYDRPDTKLIILDDAFQHRKIHSGLNIILTDYSNLYTRDFLLPTGDLRDQRSSMARAEVIIVTKCPLNLSEHEKFLILKEINPSDNQKIFFTAIRYDVPYHIITQEKFPLTRELEILLVCGIANPEPLANFIHEIAKTYDALFFKDHHIYSVDDLNDIKERFDFLSEEKKIIITTEKDAVRLMKFNELLTNVPLYVISISIVFLFNQEKDFMDLVEQYPHDFYNSLNLSSNIA